VAPAALGASSSRSRRRTRTWVAGGPPTGREIAGSRRYAQASSSGGRPGLRGGGRWRSASTRASVADHQSVFPYRWPHTRDRPDEDSSNLHLGGRRRPNASRSWRSIRQCHPERGRAAAAPPKARTSCASPFAPVQTEATARDVEGNDTGLRSEQHPAAQRDRTNGHNDRTTRKR